MNAKATLIGHESYTVHDNSAVDLTVRRDSYRLEFQFGHSNKNANLTYDLNWIFHTMIIERGCKDYRIDILQDKFSIQIPKYALKMFFFFENSKLL